MASLMCSLFAGMVSLCFLTLAMSRSLNGLAEQKNYYSPPDPHSGSGSPHKHSPHKPSCQTPSHGGGSYGTPSPPQHGAPPVVNISPPSIDPGTPTPIVSTPPTPVIIISTPSAPSIDPVTPTPIVIPRTPPMTPASPLIPDPNNPFSIGTCYYWLTHPAAVLGLLGYWGSIGQIFGFPVNAIAAPDFGHNMSLQEALANTRADGIGSLYREGTASFLNSVADKRFPFTTKQVKEAFVAAAGASDKVAGAQAKLFKQANEGHLINN